MNILITGATGFIGRHLLQRLIEEGHHCRCLARSFANVDSLFGHLQVELFEGDVTKPETLKDVGKGIDTAYHLAAAGHVASVSEQDYRAFFNLNVNGTRNIADACGKSGVRRFVHFSSTAAMGLIKLPKIDETVSCQPQTPYQKSKYQSELAALETGKKFGMEVIVFRPCMVYGPGGKGEFLKFCKLVRKGLFLRVGLGRNLTPIVHVSDVVQAAANALDRGRAGEVYLIASNTSPPLSDIFRYITSALKIKRVYYYVPFRFAYCVAFLLERLAAVSGKTPVASRKNIVSTITDRIFSISKAQRELGYIPSKPLELGINETVKWFTELGLV